MRGRTNERVVDRPRVFVSTVWPVRTLIKQGYGQSIYLSNTYMELGYMTYNY